jgi:hypothetical protein
MPSTENKLHPNQLEVVLKKHHGFWAEPGTALLNKRRFFE